MISRHRYQKQKKYNHMKELLQKSFDKHQLRQTIKTILKENSLEEDLLTRKQAADLLGVSLPTLHSYINKKWLPSYKLAGKRFLKKSDIITALNKNA